MNLPPARVHFINFLRRKFFYYCLSSNPKKLYNAPIKLASFLNLHLTTLTLGMSKGTLSNIFYSKIGKFLTKIALESNWFTTKAFSRYLSW